MSEGSDRTVRRPVGCLRLLHWLRVTFALAQDSNSNNIRTFTLASLFAIAFLAWPGIGRVVSPFSGFLADRPFNFDLALRTVSHGWYRPQFALPITLVDIDEETHRGWGSPPTTPRDDLARLIAIVTSAAPAAVVVDIDLAGGGSISRGTDHGALLAYLDSYDRAAPLIFPKRLEPGAEQTRRIAASPFDAVFARNPRLAWAHASFATQDDGAVRHWAEYLAVCEPKTDRGIGDDTATNVGPAGGRTVWLPAVATRLAELLPPRPEVLAPPVAPEPRDGCVDREVVSERRLLIGPRITGEKRSGFAQDTRAVSASLLLDRDVLREDDALFGQRIVLIGATHLGAGDLWLTPSGIYSGVEMLANTIRYAAVRTEAGPGFQIGYRATALFLFVLFVICAWALHGGVALLGCAAAAFATVASAIWVWDYFRVFDALESAILLALAFTATQGVFDVIEWIRDGPRRAREWSLLRLQARLAWILALRDRIQTWARSLPGATPVDKGIERKSDGKGEA